MAAEDYQEFYQQHDGKIVIASNRHRGVWSYLSTIRDAKMHKAAGSLPSASHNTLQAVALISALQTVNTRRIKQKTGRAKPKIQVVTASESFAELMTAALKSKRDPRKNGFKCASQFVLPLFKELVKFDLEFVIEDADNQLKLRQWATNALYRDSHVFTPQVMQQI